MTLARLVRFVVAALLGSVSIADAQAWRETATHLAGSSRVLLVGTRPEDEDNAIIALLSRGRHIETAYLSLSRGEAGMNVTGSERGAPLAVVRTAELLAERQRDGARQYFTRAFDFGAVPADSAVEAAWPRDSMLVDLVSVIRAFRPQTIIALTVMTGERDATRRYTAQLVADAFTLAGDTSRMSARSTSFLGAWTPSRLFTRIDSIADGTRIVRLDVGAFDRDEGMTYAELGAEIRRLQRTQPVLAAPTPASLVRLLRRDDRGGDDDAALFATGDTAFARFRANVPSQARAQFDTLERLITFAVSQARVGSADTVAAALARVAVRANDVRREMECRDYSGVASCAGVLGDVALSLNTIRERATRAMLDASGLIIDAVAARELIVEGDTVPVTITLRNGGGAAVTVASVIPYHRDGTAGGTVPLPMVLVPDSMAQANATMLLRQPTYHWWQITGLVPGTQLHRVRGSARDAFRGQLISGEDRLVLAGVRVTVSLGGVEVPVVTTSLVARGVTALRSDRRHPVIGVPAASLLFERGAEYERAGLTVNRLFRVFVSSYRSGGDTLQVTLDLPKGLRTDSASRMVALPPYGTRNLFFPLRGKLAPGPHVVAASARSLTALPAQSIGASQADAVREFTLGTVINDYPHIPSQHFVRFARDRFEAVELRVPPTLRVGYIRGSDDLRSALGQLRLSVTPVDLALLPVYDLSAFTTLLIGAGALRGESALAAVPSLRAFLTRGGTVVVLNGGSEIARSGLFPYPIAIDAAGGRSANDSLDVRVTDTRSALLNWPNAITPRDWSAWLGNRTCGRPTLLDARYRAPVVVLDADAKSVTPAVVTSAVGKGTLVHTTLCLGGELDAAQTGAARIIVNLLSAGLQRP